MLGELFQDALDLDSVHEQIDVAGHAGLFQQHIANNAAGDKALGLRIAV
jgi:hypothetical protein